jgi:hypothetical protein
MLPTSAHCAMDPSVLSLQQTCVECGNGDSSVPEPSSSCTGEQPVHGILPRSLNRSGVSLRVLWVTAESNMEMLTLRQDSSPVIRTPQEFLVGWQFAGRAALLPRAPSLNS